MCLFLAKEALPMRHYVLALKRALTANHQILETILKQNIVARKLADEHVFIISE